MLTECCLEYHKDKVLVVSCLFWGFFFHMLSIKNYQKDLIKTVYESY